MAYRRSYNASFGELGAAVAGRWPERSIIAKKGKRRHTLGLALSGGGYRAAIFGYGVLKGLYEIGVIGRFDYLSVVSGGAWIGTPFAMTAEMRWFFDDIKDHPNLIEEGFESLLLNPRRVAQELVLARKTANYVSNTYGRLLARTFLREFGQESRYRGLAERGMIRDADRPFLIINGTVSYRAPGSFSVTQEGFEMTRLYCGSRSIGYVSTRDLMAVEKPLRIRDAIAISGAGLTFHIPALGDEVAGFGLGREVESYAPRDQTADVLAPGVDRLDLSDGGHYNNLGMETLVSRGCGYIVLVDAEHDPEREDGSGRRQKFSGLRALLGRTHVPNPMGEDAIEVLDQPDRLVHVFEAGHGAPGVLYVKLKSSRAFDEIAAERPYNQPGFVGRLIPGDRFHFDPQFSTAKLDYDFSEHRNLSELGRFAVEHDRERIKAFVRRSR